MYLSVLGRQSDISLAELEALFDDVHPLGSTLATFESSTPPGINRLGGSLKLAVKLSEKPLDLLASLPEGKITLGVSDYSHHASTSSATKEALKLKKILVRHGRSVRVVMSKSATLSTATSLHNGLSGKNDRKLELIKVDDAWYKVISVQDIDAYSRRDQARPARDAKVGMLPPKLAQILINLCGPLRPGARVLDPFCGTGVVLQEALLMGYTPYGTDLSDRMVEYTQKNLDWLLSHNAQRHPDGEPDTSYSSGRVARARRHGASALKLALPRSVTPQNNSYQVSVGDATTHRWQTPINAVACEGYLGKPMSTAPGELKLKTEKQECKAIILGFLKNLSTQIAKGTPVVVAAPAWLTSDGSYSRLEILDEITKLGYNVNNKTREGLLYARIGQIVARDIIILRKD